MEFQVFSFCIYSLKFIYLKYLLHFSPVTERKNYKRIFHIPGDAWFDKFGELDPGETMVWPSDEIVVNFQKTVSEMSQ